MAGEGLSRRAAAQRFGISAAAAIKWLQRFQRTGERGSAGYRGHRPSKVQPHRAWVVGGASGPARHHVGRVGRPAVDGAAECR